MNNNETEHAHGGAKNASHSVFCDTIDYRLHWYSGTVRDKAQFQVKKIINLKRFSTRYTIIQARVEPVANYKCDLE